MEKSNKDDFAIEDGILKRFKGDTEEVVIPEGVVTIQEAAFIECPKLKSIVFPNTLKRIESMAFLTESTISMFPRSQHAQPSRRRYLTSFSRWAWTERLRQMP